MLGPRRVPMIMAVMVGVIVAVAGMVMAVIMVVAVRMAGAAGGMPRGDIEHVVGMLVMMVIMAAAAIGAVCMACMIVGCRLMGLMVMAMMSVLCVIVGMAMVVPVPAVIVGCMIMSGMIIGAALGLERAHHLRDRAALAADHLGQNMVRLDVERVGGDLGRGVAVADVPGHTHQPQRVLGAHLKQVLLGGADRDQPPVIEFQPVALAEHAGLVEIEQDLETAHGAQHSTAALAILMIKHHGVCNLVGPDGRLADDGSGAEHGVILCPVA
jgi:hypothetical protein